ncbi:MAG: 3-oxoacyl-ACP reductase FabG [Candidatus Eisenbacteria bacterium]|nr:3-oxoacyl-ACP reductase FabG [Candidatus Eisenbacteria bacterium]
MNRHPDLDSGLADGVAIVTGGSRGIGRAIVSVLSSAGMDVNFTFLHDQAAADELVASLPGKRVTAKLVDIRDPAACTRFAEQVCERTGKIDVLVNNAGIIRDNPLMALEDEDIAAVLDTNVTGTFNMTRAVAPWMVSKRRGKIINISSVAGEKGGRGQTNYAASKGAINAFTRSLAVELAPRNIMVNAVAPGVIDTTMSQEVREALGETVLSRILLRRIGRPEEVADAVWFLSSRFADYITGQVLNVDGGFKME